METVVVVDLGIGNLRSVERALAEAAVRAGLERRVVVGGEPEVVLRADRLVVPGQGAFRDGAAALAGGLGEALSTRIAAGAPYLGICLGLQLLFDGSDEAPGVAGLGVLAGHNVRLADGAVDRSTGAVAKIPHMGWNRLTITRRGAGPLSLWDDDPPYVYFVHSYHALPDEPALVAAVAVHGPHVVTAAIQRENVTATQFHPEKSQDAGLALLGAFLA